VPVSAACGARFAAAVRHREREGMSGTRRPDDHGGHFQKDLHGSDLWRLNLPRALMA
jgi:hypothetical protein